MAVAVTRTFVVVKNLTVAAFTAASGVEQVRFDAVLFPLVGADQLSVYPGVYVLVKYAACRFIYVRNKLGWLEEIKLCACAYLPLLRIDQVILVVDDNLLPY